MAVGRFEKQFLSDGGFKTSATAGQFYSLPSIVERMARSRTGLWWNIARNLGYHLALQNFGDAGFNPEGNTSLAHHARKPLKRLPSMSGAAGPRR